MGIWISLREGLALHWALLLGRLIMMMVISGHTRQGEQNVGQHSVAATREFFQHRLVACLH